VILPFFSAAWSGHTDASREFAIDVKDALLDLKAETGIKLKEAAALMGISDTDLSKQLAGLEPLSLWRLAALPWEFRFALFKRQLRRRGAEIVTAEDIARVRALFARRMADLSAQADALKHERQQRA
jgi:hypothetical protein